MLIPILSLILSINNSFAGKGLFENLNKIPKPGGVNTAIAPDARITGISYTGTGCPEGNLEFAISPDQQVISILFNNFAVQMGPNSGNEKSVKDCRITLPIEILNGNYQAMVQKIDYRGVASLPAGAHLSVFGSFNMRTPFNKKKEVDSWSMFSEKYSGPTDLDFLFTVKAKDSPGNSLFSKLFKTSWTPCSNRIDLNLTSRLALINQSPNQVAIATLDSADVSISPGIEYQISWRKCL
jgi:Domain of unknown function (DUF4360)